MYDFLLVANGIILALMAGLVGAAVYALKSVRQGRQMLTEINTVHNELVESVSKIDSKAQEALLRLDHLQNK